MDRLVLTLMGFSLRYDRLVLTPMRFSLRYGQTGTYSDGIFIEIWTDWYLL